MKIKNRFLYFALFIMMLTCMPSLASAHAYILKAVPLQDSELSASPKEIKLTFTERIDVKLSSITLEKAEDGSVIEGTLSNDGDLTLIYSIPELENGEYKVKWQVLSLDTHITDGSFRFAVGAELEQIKPDETVSLDGNAGLPASSNNGRSENRDSGKAADGPSTAPSSPPSAKPGASAGSGSNTGARGQAGGAPGTAKPAASPSASPASGSAASGAGAGSNAGGGGTAEPDHRHEASEAPDSDGLAVEQAPGGQEDAEQASSEPADAITASADNESEDAEHHHGEADAQSVPSSAGGHDHSGEHHSEGEHNHAGGHGLMIVLRIMDIAVGAMLAGMLFFRYALWRNQDADAPAGFTLQAERTLMAAAVAIWIASGLSRLMMLSDQLGGVPLMDIATSTIVGKIAVIRPGAALLLLLLGFAPEREQKWAIPLKFIVAAAVIVTFPLTGHAYAAVQDAAAAILAHAVHIGAAAVWLGGLVGLFSLTYRRHAFMKLNETAERFSLWAVPSMVLIVISAVWLSVIQLSSWKELFASDYGLLLVVKACLLLLVLVIGVLHKWLFIPRIARAATESSARGLKAGVRIEIILAICLFVAAGWLSSTSPPSENAVPVEPVYWHEMGEQAHMTLRVSDGYLDSAQLVRLYVWLPERMGAPESAIVKVGPLPGADGEEIDIPVQLQPSEADMIEFPGFTKYSYRAEGAFVDLRSKHQVKVDIVDEEGNEFHYEREIGG